MFDVATFKTQLMTAFRHAKLYRHFVLAPSYYPESQKQSFPSKNLVFYNGPSCVAQYYHLV